MSLFETLSDMSKQHAENSGDSGQYQYGSILDRGKIEVNFPPSEPELAPTVSLYNLLDQPYDNLFVLLQSVKRMEIEVRPEKLVQSFTYTTLCSWILLIETAIKERQAKDSEAWADQQVKEIKEATL